MSKSSQLNLNQGDKIERIFAHWVIVNLW
jgi:hypothetical protein